MRGKVLREEVWCYVFLLVCLVFLSWGEMCREEESELLNYLGGLLLFSDYIVKRLSIQNSSE